MSAKQKRNILIALPLWLAATAFVIWGYAFELGKVPFPGFGPIWSGAVMGVFMTPLLILREWLYDTGKLQRPKIKLRPWVRDWAGLKNDDEPK